MGGEIIFAPKNTWTGRWRCVCVKVGGVVWVRFVSPMVFAPLFVLRHLTPNPKPSTNLLLVLCNTTRTFLVLRTLFYNNVSVVLLYQLVGTLL